MMFRSLAVFSLFLLLQACSEKPPKTPGTLTQKECDSVGGKLVGGQCQKPLAKDEMKKVCDSLNLRYDEQHNGCVRE